MDALTLAAQRLEEPEADVFDTLGFAPNPGPQTRFLDLPDANLDVLYGGAAGDECAQGLRIWNSLHLTPPVRSTRARGPCISIRKTCSVGPERASPKRRERQSNMLAYHIVACYIGEETERGTPDVCWEARAVSYVKQREDMVEGLVVFALKRAPPGSIDDCYICD